MSKKRNINRHSPQDIPLNRVAKLIIRRALNEDLRKRGDITTRATVPQDLEGSAKIFAKSNGVIAGQLIAAEAFRSVDKRINYDILVKDGSSVSAGVTIANIKGNLAGILTAERTALNLLGRCSGVATVTSQYVLQTLGTNAKITDTRKTSPGIRYLDKAAVVSGGGVNHRYGLFDQFLIKENHIVCAGGITKAIDRCKKFREQWGNFKMTVEVTNLDELKEALAGGPDRILLDNMTPNMIRECVLQRGELQVELEASGGITLENVRQYAEAGVDFISVGALTHSVKVLDLSLLVE